MKQIKKLGLVVVTLLLSATMAFAAKPNIHILGGCVKSKNQVFFDILYKKDFISLLC